MLQRTVPHAKDLPPGEIVGKDFEVVRLVGRGSFSTVYEAVQLNRRRRRVALKVLHQGIQHEIERQAGSFIENPYLVEHALSERVRHPAFCRVHRVGSHNGRFYAALQWAEGDTLDLIIQQQRGTVPLLVAAEIIAQLGGALATMHRHQIVHRDLKPANVMVSLADGKVVVKLIDLGIAKNAGEAEDRATSATQGMLVGTPAYMAPEQATGRVTDPRSDLFSFAAVVYELLTGQRHIIPPNGGRGAESYVDYLTGASSIPTHPACELRPDLPPEVDEILATALARERRKRPATVEQFCDDMEVVLRAAAPPEPVKRASFLARFIGRLRGAVV